MKLSTALLDVFSLPNLQPHEDTPSLEEFTIVEKCGSVNHFSTSQAMVVKNLMQVYADKLGLSPTKILLTLATTESDTAGLSGWLSRECLCHT